MSRGLLDLPAPLYAGLDQLLAEALPPLGRLLVWAALAGPVSVLLYRTLSPQRRIATAKAEAAALRRRLDAHEGDLAGALPLLRAQLGASLRHVGLVLPATLVASLPVLSLLVWLETAYGHTLPPPQEPPHLVVSPGHLTARWHPRPPRVVVREGRATVAEVRLVAPVTRVEPHRWWNALIANPVGYLPDEGPARQLRIELPPRRYLGRGPGWIDNWATVFLAALVAVSLGVHRLARVH